MGDVRARCSFLFFVVCCLPICLVRSASAEMCTSDTVPAATILVPYFSVDLAACDDSTGETTIVYLQNASASPVIAHAVLWTDLSVPTFTFDVYLTGYDILPMNLRDIFCKGMYPETAGGVNTDPTATELARFTAWHQGRAAPDTGKCGGSARNSDTAVGYITFDNADVALGTQTPADGDGYFANVNDNNSLTAHVYHNGVIDVEEASLSSTPVEAPAKQSCRKKKKLRAKLKCKGRNQAIDQLSTLLEPKVSLQSTTTRQSIALQGYPAVHIEANPMFTSASSTTGLTFYGRYVTAGLDHREPLPSIYSSLYRQTLNQSSSDDESEHDLIFWRTGTNNSDPFECGFEQTIHPFTVTQVVAFDEAEDAVDVTNALSLKNEVTLLENFPDDASPYTNGWFYFNLSGSQVYLLQRRDGIYDTAGTTALSNPCTGMGLAP